MEQHEHGEGKECCGGMGASSCGGGGCRCMHHKMVPILVVLFGLLFLLGNFGVVGTKVVSIGWPIIVLLGGLTKLMGSACKCCK